MPAAQLLCWDGPVGGLPWRAPHCTPCQAGAGQVSPVSLSRWLLWRAPHCSPWVLLRVGYGERCQAGAGQPWTEQLCAEAAWPAPTPDKGCIVLGRSRRRSCRLLELSLVGLGLAFSHHLPSVGGGSAGVSTGLSHVQVLAAPTAWPGSGSLLPGWPVGPGQGLHPPANLPHQGAAPCLWSAVSMWS